MEETFKEQFNKLLFRAFDLLEERKLGFFASTDEYFFAPLDWEREDTDLRLTVKSTMERPDCWGVLFDFFLE